MQHPLSSITNRSKPTYGEKIVFIKNAPQVVIPQNVYEKVRGWMGAIRAEIS